jgi:bifunctional DNA-binding transcriptional regulator/antitoxin component of YhaV-PrlF toxin-antitoxin module
MTRHLDEIDRKIWVYKTKLHDKLVTAPLLSENQLTIPVKVRKLLEIQSEDTIDFGYSDDQKYVYFKKRLDTLTCPVCTGSGNIEGHKCAVCRENGVVEVESL